MKTLRRFFDSCSDPICYLLVIRKEINQITAEDNLITAATELHPVKLRRDMQHAAAVAAVTCNAAYAGRSHG